MDANVTSPTVGQLRERFTIAQLIERIVKLRDRTAALKREHTEQLKPVSQMQDLLEAAILEHLNEQNADSIATDAGTAYKSTRTSARVESWADVLDFIRDNEAWELLEARVSKTAALEIIRERKAPIPGVTISSDVALNVRRG